MASHLRRIEIVNTRLNAVVNLTSEAALAEARSADDALARGEKWGRSICKVSASETTPPLMSCLQTFPATLPLETSPRTRGAVDCRLDFTERRGD